MRFLFNTVYYKPAKGGGGPLLSVSFLAEELVRRGHQVTVAASDLDIPGRIDVDFNKTNKVNGVDVRYFRARPTLLQRTGIPAFACSAVFQFGPEFSSWLSEFGPTCDVIHSHITYTYSNALCANFARKHGKVYLYHQRGNLDPLRLKRGRLKKAIFIWLRERPIMKSADALIALTEKEVETYRALKLRNRIEIIPNGFDPPSTTKGTPSTTVADIIRVTAGRPVFLFISRIHPTKGPDLLVEAFIKAAKITTNIHCVLAGPDEAMMVPILTERVREVGLSSQFHYAGIADTNDKHALFKAATVFVLPTEAEGFSMVLLEALASGCPVITTPGAYFNDIEGCGAGKIVPLNIDKIAAQMTEFIKTDHSAMQAMGERGQRLVRDRFSWAKITQTYEHLCGELCAAKRSKMKDSATL
ncbi:MAG: glycosyltransferase [Nibricoccus sp.]